MSRTKPVTLDQIRKLIREESARARRKALPTVAGLDGQDPPDEIAADTLKGRLPAYTDTAGAAIYCDLSEAGLITMRRERRGPPFIKCTQRMLRYSYDALDVWMEGHRVEAES